jgi:hypothetical protein
MEDIGARGAHVATKVHGNIGAHVLHLWSTWHMHMAYMAHVHGTWQKAHGIHGTWHTCPIQGNGRGRIDGSRGKAEETQTELATERNSRERGEVESRLSTYTKENPSLSFHPSLCVPPRLCLLSLSRSVLGCVCVCGGGGVCGCARVYVYVYPHICAVFFRAHML